MILPDLAELTALRGAARGLDLHAHRPALARLHGNHRSAQRGRGLEFEEVRPYAAGDDVRSIDWRVTARRGKPHTKLFREERERPVWLVLDLHAGLYFGSRRQLKSAAMLRAAAMLAWVAALGGDRLGAIIAQGEGGPVVYPPRAREAGVLPVLNAMVEAQPRAPGQAVDGHLASLLSTLRPVVQPGSLVLLLSDFAALDDVAEPHLAAMAAHVDCRLLWVCDPLEASGLPAGRFRLGVPGRVRWLDGSDSLAAWRAHWAARETRLVQMADRLNLPLQRIATADPVDETLIRLLKEPAWAA